jgi:S-adenosylmethionine hydrolase
MYITEIKIRCKINEMKPNNIVCLLTDFGISDRFTGIMKGVACSVDAGIKIYDISHEIPPYNIREASWLLSETLPSWPEGTSFVTVVDPGVGSGRKALAAKTRSGHYVFCPDNGILSLVEKNAGIEEVRLIDTHKNRLPGTSGSETFHGRDIFIYNAARVASGKISFESLGFLYTGILVSLDFPNARVTGQKIAGAITRIEEPFGNLCTNILSDEVFGNGWKSGDKVKVTIYSGKKPAWSGVSIIEKTFSSVPAGATVIYPDSSGRIGIARNRHRIFERGAIQTGEEARVAIEKL